MTIINDIVHGIIKCPDYIKEIIDTVHFQRLRHISQLGLNIYVYPCASYSRFEHCIGTFYLTSKLLKQIELQLQNDKNKELLSENDIKCVEIAALCHDLGHGPYSHFWEYVFDETIPKRKHEDISVDIFRDLINTQKSNNDQTIKIKLGLDEKMIDLICRIICGKYDKQKDGNKLFLFEIVANKESGLDVDKFDYICRDSIYLGWSNKNKIHDIERIIHFFRICQDDNTKNWHLAMRDREIFHIHDVFYYRHLLHRYGYQHKTVKSVECMFKKAMKTIVENGKYRNELISNVLLLKNEDYNSDIWFSKEFTSRVCDYHIWEIFNKYTKEIVDNIHERNLPKFYGQFKIECKENKKDGGFNDIFEIEKIYNNSISVALSKFSLQSENKGNPLMAVKFYKKGENKCFNFTEDSLPDLVRLMNNEYVMMIFSKDLDESTRNYLDSFKRKLIGEIELNNEDHVIRKIRSKYKFEFLNY